MRARHRVAKLLLRHDQRFDGANWTAAHRQWLNHVVLVDPVAQAVLLDAIGAVDALVVRRENLERQMTALVPDSPWAQTIGRLRTLRGIDTLSALGLAAEVGDFARFERPEQLMSFLGLVPSEHRPASSAGKARSPSRARHMRVGCWSRPPGTIAAIPRAVASSRAAKTASRSMSAPSAGRPSGGCIAPGSASTASAASAARSSPSPRRASSPVSAGRSRPPTEPQATAHVGRGGGGTRGPSRQRIRDDSYEQPFRVPARSRSS